MLLPYQHSHQNAERALLVGVQLPGQSRGEAQDSLEELANLAYSAGAHAVAIVSQDIKRIDAATFLGSGKVEEIKQLIQTKECDLILFDEDLTATQHRNLEEILEKKVVDRTGLILDIFAQRARTKEGKLQVELAQYLYLLPRLVGKGIHMSRQTGGIGTRGPGETQLEVDRRRLREKITRIRRELEGVKASRHLHRAKRLSVPIPTVSLVGYTNAGKSTLFHALTKAEVLVEDKLFATLDPTVRRVKLPSGREILMSDTVGFIRKLPHALVESFKATFEEIEGADLLLHVIDVSHPLKKEQIKMVHQVLSEIGLSKKHMIEVFNKIDLTGGTVKPERGKIYVSASKRHNIDELLQVLDEVISRGSKKMTLQVPYREGSLVAFLHQHARILSKSYGEEGLKIEVEVYEKYLPMLKSYRIKKGAGLKPAPTKNTKNNLLI